MRPPRVREVEWTAGVEKLQLSWPLWGSQGHWVSCSRGAGGLPWLLAWWGHQGLCSKEHKAEAAAGLEPLSRQDGSRGQEGSPLPGTM